MLDVVLLTGVPVNDEHSIAATGSCQKGVEDVDGECCVVRCMIVEGKVRSESAYTIRIRQRDSADKCVSGSRCWWTEPRTTQAVMNPSRAQVGGKPWG